MRLLPPIVAALVATAAPAATVRVVPWHATAVPEGSAAAVARASEAALRELSSLAVQPALQPATLSKRCTGADPGCWAGLAGRAGTDYALVLSAESTSGLTVDLVLVDLKAGTAAARHFTAVSPDAAAPSARAAVEALVPAHLRRGYGGVLLDMPPGSRLKVDGKVVLGQPSRGPVAVPGGRHEVDLLLPDGTAVLGRAEVAEGQTSPLALNVRPPSGERRSNDALRITSAGLWAAGTVAVVTLLALATVVNLRSDRLNPCVDPSRDCLTLEAATNEQAMQAGYMRTANILLIGGGVLAVGGGLVFTFDLVQGGGQ